MYVGSKRSDQLPACFGFCFTYPAKLHIMIHVISSAPSRSELRCFTVSQKHRPQYTHPHSRFHVTVYQPIGLLYFPSQPNRLLYFPCSGKAPYHNYPPMKILMMTLGRDPPTLDDCLEDGDNAKYSKPFKKIIEKYV